MINYLKLVRPINLLVIIVTQVLLYFLIIFPAFHHAELQNTLNYFLFFQLVLCTVLLAAGAYIINDIYDIEIDKINKPAKQIVTNQLSISTAYKYYIIVCSIGFLFAINIAYHSDKINLLWIYPISVLGLFLYAKSWKTKLFIGNIIVALFSAFVAGILWVSELRSLTQLYSANMDAYHNITHLLCFYMLFAFLISLFREIIKDMQDQEGDQVVEAKTLILVYGQKKTKLIAHFISLVTIISLGLWIWNKFDLYSLWTSLLLLIGVILPLLYLQVLLNRARISEHYNAISQYTKIVMIIGIVYLFLL